MRVQSIENGRTLEMEIVIRYLTQTDADVESIHHKASPMANGNYKTLLMILLDVMILNVLGSIY
jgi:hypothetical protein